jgi:hypothetical protein
MVVVHPWGQTGWQNEAAFVEVAEAEAKVGGLVVAFGSCKDCCQAEGGGKAELRKDYFVAVVVVALSSFVIAK